MRIAKLVCHISDDMSEEYMLSLIPKPKEEQWTPHKGYKEPKDGIYK